MYGNSIHSPLNFSDGASLQGGTEPGGGVQHQDFIDINWGVLPNQVL